MLFRVPEPRKFLSPRSIATDSCAKRVQKSFNRRSARFRLTQVAQGNGCLGAQAIDSPAKPLPIGRRNRARRCPVCEQESIIGHGRRRKQAHDEHHDWIGVRRGRCAICGRTFTFLPLFSLPLHALQPTGALPGIAAAFCGAVLTGEGITQAQGL